MRPLRLRAPQTAVVTVTIAAETTMKLFGTDGIRGKAGDAPLMPETVARVGAALVQDDDRRAIRVIGCAS